MKNTTLQVYNLVTSEIFQNIEIILSESVKQQNWVIPERNEVTYEELLEELPNQIDILKQACENSSFDKLHPTHRPVIEQTLVQMSSTITNIKSGHQQFAQLQDQYIQLMVQMQSYGVDKCIESIPRYTQKLKEYNDLIKKLKIVVEYSDEILKKRDEFKTLVVEFQDIIDSFQVQKEKTDRLEEQINNKHQTILELYSKAENTVLTMNDQKESANVELQSIKISNQEIKKIENDTKLFFNDIEEAKLKINDLVTKTKEDIKNLHISSNNLLDEYMTKTNEIIIQNEIQSNEIDKQLSKAVGVNLFKSFEVRRKLLNRGITRWLNTLALSVASLIAISFWIYWEITHKTDMNIYMFVFKIIMSFPFIFVVAFIANRYTKERRLEEEYAFKSSISLALKPYSDLVAKMDSDPEHKQFLIEAIRNIFSEPTERVFGGKKESSTDSKKLNEYVDIIKKLSEVKTDN